MQVKLEVGFILVCSTRKHHINERTTSNRSKLTEYRYMIMKLCVILCDNCSNCIFNRAEMKILVKNETSVLFILVFRFFIALWRTNCFGLVEYVKKEKVKKTKKNFCNNSTAVFPIRIGTYKKISSVF